MPDRSRVSTCSSIRVNFLSIVKKLIDRTLITDDQASFFEMKFYANVEESLSIRYGVIGRQKKKKKRKEKKLDYFSSLSLATCLFFELFKLLEIQGIIRTFVSRHNKVELLRYFVRRYGAPREMLNL